MEPAGQTRRTPLVSLIRVTKSYDRGRVMALRSVSMDIPPGSFLAVIGPSGCGKSTLLAILGAMDSPDSGQALYHGEPLKSASARAAFRSRTVGFVFQSYHLIPSLNALENVQIPMFEMPWPPRQRAARAQRLLEEVGLGHRAHHLPHELSGGERQRVAIARALANQPALLLADEPTGNLDSATANSILDLLGRLHETHGLAIVLVTHDIHIASRAKKLLRMHDGQIE